MTSRSREDQIAAAVTKYLFDAGGQATIAQIRKALPHYLPLSADDRRPSPTRNGEQIWEQQVRNIVSHRDAQGNAIQCGMLARKPGRLILPKGPQLELY